MKKQILFLTLAIALTACGSEKRDAPDFGRTEDGSWATDMPIEEFRVHCAKLNGTVLAGDLMCQMPDGILAFDKAKIDQMFPAGVAFAMVELGARKAGGLAWGEVDGAQAVEILTNGAIAVTMHPPGLAKTFIPPGNWQLRIFRGTYEKITFNVLVCRSRRNVEVRCPA